MRLIKNNSKYGKKAKGKAELNKHLMGIKLTRGQAILAMCYDCLGGYDDGKYSCKVSHCPLYIYMPYSGNVPPENCNPSSLEDIPEGVGE